MDKDEEIINDLRELRKKSKLSLNDVSHRLKLSTSILEKLENNHFEDIGAYTYVRGYLMNYTQFLNVDSEKYLSLIPATMSKPELINTYSKSSKLITLKKHSDGIGRYVSGTLVILVLGFMSWYLLKMYSNKRDVFRGSGANTSIEIGSTQERDNTPTTTDDTDKIYISSMIPSSTEELSGEIQQKSIGNLVETNNSAEEALTQDSQLTNEQNELGLTPELIHIVTDNLTDKSEDLVEDKTITEIDEPIVENEMSSVNNQSSKFLYEVEFVTKADSWIELVEEDGERLFYGTMPAGSRSFKSNKPLNFRIGNERKVSLKINGEKINLADYSNKYLATINWPLTNNEIN